MSHCHTRTSNSKDDGDHHTSSKNNTQNNTSNKNGKNNNHDHDNSPVLGAGGLMWYVGYLATGELYAGCLGPRGRGRPGCLRRGPCPTRPTVLMMLLCRRTGAAIVLMTLLYMAPPLPHTRTRMPSTGASPIISSILGSFSPSLGPLMLP